MPLRCSSNCFAYPGGISPRPSTKKPRERIAPRHSHAGQERDCPREMLGWRVHAGFHPSQRLVLVQRSSPLKIAHRRAALRERPVMSRHASLRPTAWPGDASSAVVRPLCAAYLSSMSLDGQQRPPKRPSDRRTRRFATNPEILIAPRFRNRTAPCPY